MKKAIGYTRMGALENNNPQKEKIKHYCIDNGISLLEIFEDIGQSGERENRKSWQALEAYLSQHIGQIDLLIVSNFDRLTRDFKIWGNLEKQLNDQFLVEIVKVEQNKFEDYEPIDLEI